MKYNKSGNSSFDLYHLDDKIDRVVSIGQINFKRIKKMTMKKIREEKRETESPWNKRWIKAASAACFILLISSATVFAAANGSIKATIGELLGISQSQILTVGESVSSKDYLLTVDEIVCDSYTGMVTVSVEALSPKARENFLNDNIVNKFGHIGSVGYGIRELEDQQEDRTRYFSFSFTVSDLRHQKDGLTFSLEGMSKEIKVPITQTIELSEKDIQVPAVKLYPVTYQKLYYSELGFTLSGEIVNNAYDLENMDISIEFRNGSTSNFYHVFRDKAEPQISGTAAATSASSSGQGIETVTANTTVQEDDSNSEVAFDEEWWSGGSVYSPDRKSLTTIFSFSKKMDWDTVKCITINGTTVEMH